MALEIDWTPESLVQHAIKHGMCPMTSDACTQAHDRWENLAMETAFGMMIDAISNVPRTEKFLSPSGAVHFVNRSADSILADLLEWAKANQKVEGPRESDGGAAQ